ncbi:amino acid ABC transporter permease [Paenirhodobacter populi]|uniref:Amino acid ABC transporter permease n=1 Tax=Paenirhodobacter populi TaxID=2306993 RepID=A0A443K067_9RHOB|nr:amino acid ABC transporter permease [Sinirhodobacter populi]RWR04252.1 amino acid ABC transporter permease [Sinirhodobacter populi]RWR05529.1 amino acid ABC transporter permease [Sinirhodobacter populi]RWR16667.1 amino acid ABC transporter permease [Sinirhodobacter populi]RWR26081.1 amino acid ABC transporter permease [Sinirhodobacter populi]
MIGKPSPTAPFVRKHMLPAEVPPARASGAPKWLRENLFSSWANTALTLFGLFILYLLVSHFAPWFLHGVWQADSLAQCRQIIAERWGEGASGACWAVIRARWTQFLFGFYPSQLYWRPVLAFVLMFVAIAPVLFTQLPRKMLWFTLAYPLVAIWLLWGGSIWPVAMIAVGFALGALAYRLLALRSSLLASLAAIAVPLLFWSFLTGPIDSVLTSVVPLAIQPVPSREFGGFLLAIVLGLGGIAMSLPLGIVLALGRQSDMFLIKTFSVMFIEFIRGVPLIALLFVASLLLNYFLPPGTNFDIILRVMILVTLFSAAYIAEVIRGGLAALPRGQYEAADALGLDYWKAQRLIILPQALKISIPGIVSTFIGMFKDTTLVTFVGLFEPLKSIPDTIRADFAWKGVYWEPFVFVGAIFFLFNFGMSRYSMYLERKLKRDYR